MTTTQAAAKAATLIKTRAILGEDYDACFQHNRERVTELLIQTAGDDPTLVAAMRWHGLFHLVTYVYDQNT